MNKMLPKGANKAFIETFYRNYPATTIGLNDDIMDDVDFVADGDADGDYCQWLWRWEGQEMSDQLIREFGAEGVCKPLVRYTCICLIFCPSCTQVVL